MNADADAGEGRKEGWKEKEKIETFAWDAVAERLLVVEWETFLTVAAHSVAATDTLERPGRIDLATTDALTVTCTLRHYLQTANRIVLLFNHNNMHRYSLLHCSPMSNYPPPPCSIGEAVE